ncbi:MAG: Dabb family protein [Chitinophagaceae bacterium]
MIRHTVIFTLKQRGNAAAETAFFNAARELSAIPGVQHFECLRQTNKKNNFDYGVSMEFNNRKTYEAYNQHPDHLAFIENYWLKEVADFLEIDYGPL